MRHRNKLIFLITGMVLFSVVFTGCIKQKLDQNWAGPYRDPVRPSVKFLSLYPSPEQGSAGDVITFKMAGLDSILAIRNADPTAITFQFNGSNAVIDTISAGDSTIRVFVPGSASSGSVTLKIYNDKTYFGPLFRVIGNVWIDSTFIRTGEVDEKGNDILGGTNGVIYDMEYNNFGGRASLFLSGNFTNWNDTATYDYAGNLLNYTRYIIEINPVDGSLRTDFNKLGGPRGAVRGILPLTAFPGYLLYGSIDRYDYNGLWDGNTNMMRIYRDGAYDFIAKEVYNPDPLSIRNIDTIPAFLGGTDGIPIKVFLDHRGRLITVGNFTTHKFNLLDQATFSNVPYRSTTVPQVMAQDQDGNLDLSYGYPDATELPFVGGILDAVQLLGEGNPYGKIIITGGFTNGVAMLDENGKIDQSFQARVNGNVSKITYNRVTRKILISGTFSQVNGMPTPAGLAMLNEDGTLSTTFNLGQILPATDIRGQLVTYAGQLSDGKIIVSGNFGSYIEQGGSEQVIRRGFMILDENGMLAPGFNTTGLFRGQINDIFEYNYSTTNPKVVIAGSISIFDNEPVKNIVRIGMYRKI